MPVAIEYWRIKGDDFSDNHQWLEAIECYEKAVAGLNAQAFPILLLRAHAYNKSQCWDAALADAHVVLQTSPNHEKAMETVSIALYGLRRFKECYDQVLRLISHYPQSLVNLQTCHRRRREEASDYRWGEMLDEAIEGSPKPDMDRGDYVGPVEVRRCGIESRGRGLFTTKDVHAGDLLAVEKAFSVAFPDENIARPYDPMNDEREHEKPMKQLTGLVSAISLKLQKNKSFIPTFAQLYAGPNADEKINPGTGHAPADDTFVELRALYNSYTFPIIGKTFRWRDSSSTKYLDIDSPSDAHATAPAIGIWILASYLNHSCYPTVRRSYIGDMLILRASQDVPADTELTAAYLSRHQEHSEREEHFSRYGFTCECSICVAERSTPADRLEQREKISKKIVALFEEPTATMISEYHALLQQLDNTYVHPVEREPRCASILPIINLMKACHIDHMNLDVIKLGLVLLRSLGFQLEVTSVSFEVFIWGLLTEEVLSALEYMWAAYGLMWPEGSRGIEEVARKAYVIMVGEDASFEANFGWCRVRGETLGKQGGDRVMSSEAEGKSGETSEETEEEPEKMAVDETAEQTMRSQ